MSEQADVAACETAVGSGRREWLWHAVALAALMVAGAILRWLAARNELWLDEIVSLETVRKLGSAGEVFTRIHWDNNHYLNSLYLYAVRGESDPVVLRGLSIVCGVLTIPAAWWLGVQVSRRVGWVLALMVTCSYPLIHFSSEARGYSGAVLGMVTAFAALCAWMKRRTWGMGIVYGAGVTFGLLSHLTAVLAWGPLAAGSLVYVLIGKRKWRGVGGWVGMNCIPGVVMGWLWWVDLREMQELGGPTMSLEEGAARLMSFSFGWPWRDLWSMAALLGVVVLVVGWRAMRWAREGNWLGAVMIGVMMVPAFCALVMTPAFFAPRYFLVLAPPIYLAVGSWCVGWAQGKWKWVGAGLLGLFLVGEGMQYGKLLREGRGSVGAGLRYIAESTTAPYLNVASSQDFRAEIELGYYGRVTGKRPVSYIKERDVGFFEPDWYIVHSEGYEPEGPAQLQAGGFRWERVRYFPSTELSGQAWTVYRRVGG